MRAVSIKASADLKQPSNSLLLLGQVAGNKCGELSEHHILLLIKLNQPQHAFRNQPLHLIDLGQSRSITDSQATPTLASFGFSWKLVDSHIASLGSSLKQHS
ncbi:Hypothetical predicted protein [Podarcis lilfordi]|uniref:Uncharacterized protein n=1 Tax=Podarcis lilfordi TaxID=74358 RepID=A0AA35LB91_9SAUR|nr:Hypothetical predicted protein [Podarcis lilfordi]